jgi:hypothetical protein
VRKRILLEWLRRHSEAVPESRLGVSIRNFQQRFPRAFQALYWGLPPLACLVVFYQALFGWFVQDDFAGLLIAQATGSVTDALQWLVKPLAQGVVRPLPDAFFWIGLYHLAGFNAFPYRLVVFLTQFANIVLLVGLARRLTGSRRAGWAAGLVWSMNASLVIGMAWTSAYSQILCAFFFLAGFVLFLRHLDTGRWTWYWAQCAAFVAGLETLEISVVYPVLLLLYCGLAARSHVWRTLPLLAVSCLYTVAHLWLIPRASVGPYTLHVDSSMFSGLWRYWNTAVGAGRFVEMFELPGPLGAGLVLLLTGGLAWAIVSTRIRTHRRVALLGLAWFLLALAPVLPLRDQWMSYYLTIPTIGLALAAAAVLPSIQVRPVAILWLLIYFACSVPVLRVGVRFWQERSQAARQLLEGVRQIRSRSPDRTILLAGISDRTFYAAIYDRGLAVMGLRDVYVAPDTTAVTRPGFRPVESYQFPARATLEAVRTGQVEVYRVSEDGRMSALRAEEWARRLRPAPPAQVDAGQPHMADALGPGWYDISDRIRWMGRRAELRMAAPKTSGRRLRIRAVYPTSRNVGPIRLTVFINGMRAGEAEIRDEASTEHFFPLPDSVIGSGEMTVRVETDHTFRAPPDERDLSVAFGTFELI